MNELKACPILCNLEQLNDRINNLSTGLVSMGAKDTVLVHKAFLETVLGYVEELLGMRREKENCRAEPENKPTETPRCDKCKHCTYALSKKADGYTYYCGLNGRDVVQSHFGHNSPRVCPLRTFINRPLELHFGGGNKPLTLKQLRQMDGKPVYCVGIKNQGLTGWGLVCTDGHEIIDSYGDFWEFLAYGEEYVAYAHKPEQEEK